MNKVVDAVEVMKFELFFDFKNTKNYRGLGNAVYDKEMSDLTVRRCPKHCMILS